MSAFCLQAAWMSFIDGSGALSPMLIECVEHFSFFILSWECPFPGRGGLLPGLKPAAAQAGFNSSLDPGAAGGGK
jgi:hypothetical protein